MAQLKLLLALGVIAAAAPVSASQPDPAVAPVAPAGTPTTRYCLRVDPVIGTISETILCWTRDEWAEQGVDVDKEWAANGVKTLG